VPEITRSKIGAILAELRRYQVDFIVVGGVAAVLEGVPVNTFDLDVVHSRTPDNIDRLRMALGSLGAVCGMRAVLDLLGEIGRSRGYDELLPHTGEMELSAGLHVRVLNLEMLIAVKEEIAGAKDLAVLPVMRRTLEEKQRR